MSETRPSFQPMRVLGLELAGAKSQKTALAVLEYYPKEKKAFLLDVYEKIASEDEESPDMALLETLKEVTSRDGTARPVLAVNVPLTLPPCLECKKACILPKKCVSPSVKWMREQVQRADAEDCEVRTREITPYTQRPFEIWARYRLLPRLAKEARFEIDEALGGNRGPLTARMQFLKRHLTDFRLIEALPKLTVAALCTELRISRRVYQKYRKPEDGFEARMTILEHICEGDQIFVYERDQRKLATSLTAFDAFICAYTALMSEQGKTVKPPRGYPKEAGWVEYPEGSVFK